ncbi:MAG: phosphoenolpyruvate synthase [Candidatus Omnitrophota bacterium]|nr:MAG: phosphoenolpyruvate synthase [Candidatus Omnitrophota bacterium]
MNLESKVIESGIPTLDEVLQGIRLGDNVVWQIEELDDYTYFAQPFAGKAIQNGYACVYLRFASHSSILAPQPGLTIIEVDAWAGFDYFSSEVHRIIEEKGRRCFYVFDNLSALVAKWATDELLANFFQVTCPFLFELDTVAYFALKLGNHKDNAVARIRDTTQLLINVYHSDGKRFFHPLKVWDRYSSQMFLPHEISAEEILPISHSGDAAAITARARKQPLRAGADSTAPWETVYRKLLQYYEDGKCDTSAKREILYLKQELTKMIIGAHPDFTPLAEQYFTLEDLFNVRNRIIGSGRIGGKAAGMLLARSILQYDKNEYDFSPILDDHDSFYIGSDVFFTFLVNNNLFRLRLQLSRGAQISHDEFEEIERRFLMGSFPREIMEQFQNMLEYFGQAPIIVRSSSLLEDSFGNAFAGKYRSEFCTNQGSPEDRMEAFLQAVKLVYASALNPDALSYRRKRGLDERDEQMALLVQRVSGISYKKYFFPMLAGVAFSHNLYAWTDRIDSEQGIIRLVFGLGTRAVDRTGGDYPRLIAVSHPELRPERGDKVIKYSQREIDLLNLEENRFETLLVSEIIASGDFPNMHLFISTLKDGYLSDPVSAFFDEDAEEYVLTFNNLIRRTELVSILGTMLAKIEKAYGIPVDTEFTAYVNSKDKVRINLVQCRPMGVPGAEGQPVQIPTNIPPDDILFKAHRIVSGGVVENIRYILIIDPRAYAALTNMDKKSMLGRVVGRINSHPRILDGKCIMMGPGRWGSSNINLGVNVRYAEINNTSVLVEIAREEAGQVPEVSYGTHFFLDLVEAQIIYLPVYPSDPKTQFNEIYFNQSPNMLTDIFPDAEDFSGLIKIIDVAAEGKRLQVVADPQSQKAVCYLIRD